MRSNGGSDSDTSSASVLAVGELVRPRGRAGELALDGSARRLERVVAEVGRDPKRPAPDNPATAERQVDLGAVPIAERDAVSGGDRYQIDRPAGQGSEPDDAGTGDAVDLRHIGRQRHRAALREASQHLPKCADAALACELAAMVAGTADRADAEMLGRN